jgi:hypothetical protein
MQNIELLLIASSSERLQEGKPFRKTSNGLSEKKIWLNNVGIAFGEKADTHENDVGRLRRWRGRVEAWGVRERTISRSEKYAGGGSFDFGNVECGLLYTVPKVHEFSRMFFAATNIIMKDG